jgi:hypothetical protein
VTGSATVTITGPAIVDISRRSVGSGTFNLLGSWTDFLQQSDVETSDRSLSVDFTGFAGTSRGGLAQIVSIDVQFTVVASGVTFDLAGSATPRGRPPPRSP